MCVCLRVSINHELVRTIIHQPFKLGSPNLDQRCRRPWNSLVLYPDGTIGAQWAIDSAIGTGFYKLLSVFARLYTPHMQQFYMATFTNHRNNSKTAPISLYLVWYPLGNPWLRWLQWAIFSVEDTRYRDMGYRSLFHILISFVHTGPFSMLTHRPCHGPWMVIWDSGTVRPILQKLT